MLCEPRANDRMLVRSVVIENEVQFSASRRRTADVLKEAEEFRVLVG
jgi:hypothetical protein